MRYRLPERLREPPQEPRPVALAQRERAAVIPIVGARTLEQTCRDVASLDVVLTEEDLALLDRVSRVEPGFPHDFEAIGLAHGDTFSLVDDDR